MWGFRLQVPYSRGQLPFFVLQFQHPAGDSAQSNMQHRRMCHRDYLGPESGSALIKVHLHLVHLSNSFQRIRLILRKPSL